MVIYAAWNLVLILPLSFHRMVGLKKGGAHGLIISNFVHKFILNKKLA